MAKSGFSPRAKWIWDEGDEHPRNAWLLFRKDFMASPSALRGSILRVCADSRYEARLNGTRLGGGPARSWPDSLFVDEYLLDGAGRVGVNRIEILVNHFGLGTCSYIEGPAGLIAEIEQGGAGADCKRIGSDSSWTVATHPGYARVVPKMANGLSWAEVYRADEASNESGWRWRAATEKTGAEYAARKLTPRDIDYLTDEPVYPEAVISYRRARRRGFVRSVNLRPVVFPGQLDANKHKVFRGFIAFGLRSEGERTARAAFVNDPHDAKPLSLNLNGKNAGVINGAFTELRLVDGMNWALLDVSGMFHDPEFHIVFDLPPGCRLTSLFEASGSAAEDGELAFVGPFGAISRVQAGEPLDLELPRDADYDRLASARSLEDVLAFAGRAARLGPECVSPHHVALESIYQIPIEDLPPPASLSQLCRPCGDGQASVGAELDARGDCRELVLDYGRELSGFLELEVEASAGTVLDFFCYESQHDGIIEHTFSLNNSLRYLCREGRQRYRSPLRRGFRYCKLTVLSRSPSVRIHMARLMLSTYPVAAAGRFRCSDFLLDRIWELCRHTVRMCMEDTFVDCPAYEQTLWTGDGFTSSLFSYYLFGRYEFPAHGNRLAARSLDRSLLVESTVPSAWQNVIPNWSFLWVQSCIDHYLYSGDLATFEELFPALELTLRNALRYVREDGPLAGLFAIDAWNFIDWAPIDSPDRGAVAHQNAILVWTLRRLAGAARTIGRARTADELERRARSLASRIDEAFWSEEREAYIDCIREGGSRSTSFSLHSQLFMYVAGVGSEERRREIGTYLVDLPEGFVDIASPFVRLFHFKALLDMERRDLDARVLSSIRSIWGEMLRRGATTAWEGWSFVPGHYTRSHCHAWSSGPAFFFGAYLLGIRPLEPGFAIALISPRFEVLDWLEGAVPTPRGLIEIKAEAIEGGWEIRVEAPKDIVLEFKPPPGLEIADGADRASLVPKRVGPSTSAYELQLIGGRSS